MSKQNATCDKCGTRAVIAWGCPKCNRWLCNVCSGQSKEHPRDMGGFVMTGPGNGNPKCPVCS